MENSEYTATITKKSVTHLIQKKRSQYLTALKKNKRSSSTPNADNHINIEILNELFDIASCKCFTLLTDEENIQEFNCKCAPKKKIPDNAIAFYIDQRTTRQYLISSIGANASVNEAEVSLSTVNESLATELSTITISDSDTTSSTHPPHDQTTTNTSQNISMCSGGTDSTPTVLSDDIAGDPDFETTSTVAASINAENVSDIDLTGVAMICDAKHVSLRAAAGIVSATLHAQAQVQRNKDKKESSSYTAPIISHHTFRSALNRTRQTNLARSNKAASDMICFQFDGKICDTLVTNNDLAKRRNEVKKIEYIVIVKQPGDVFVASIPITSRSSAANIFDAMKEYLKKNDISLRNVVAIGCDGAPVNTGVENGIIRRFEEFLGWPIQWIVCLLHLNELMFHRLFALLDSSSCSPHGYASELGHQLQVCETLKIVKFNRIKLDIDKLPANIDDWNLTSDQKYLLELAKAIDGGIVSDKLAKQKPGNMHKARWATTMSRTLRVYASVKHPSIILQILVTYIMKVYIPVLLAIKGQPSFVHGSRHLHLLCSLCQRYFDKKEPAYSSAYKEMKNTVNNNGYFANCESILLAMITDQDQHIRKMAYDYIITARLIRHEAAADVVRFFEKPNNINFGAKHYSNLIRINLDNIWEPPVLQTMKLSVQDLQELRLSHDIIQIPEIPSHTQATERYVQVTAQQVKRTSNIQLQQGAIHNTATYRSAMPKFNSVRDFNMPSIS